MSQQTRHGRERRVFSTQGFFASWRLRVSPSQQNVRSLSRHPRLECQIAIRLDRSRGPQPPPCELASPDHVLEYLARYLTGGPISNRRLVAEENGTVTFSARRGTTRGGDRCDVEECPLPGVEFVRRWCLHILPKGYTKTRRFGGYSNRHRKRYLAECEALLTAKGIDFASVLPSADNDVHPEADAASAESGLRCPQCDRPMVRVASSTRPSWFDVMRGLQRPSWYARQDSWPGPVGTRAARASPQWSEPSRPP